jgi:putative addiction module component (TIGR02574 family)
MSLDVQEILNQLLTLPADSRAAIAAKLLESLDDKEEQKNKAAWAREAESRLEAYDRGLMSSVPGEKVLEGLRSGSKK